jgi:hypothetical protein
MSAPVARNWWAAVVSATVVVAYKPNDITVRLIAPKQSDSSGGKPAAITGASHMALGPHSSLLKPKTVFIQGRLGNTNVQTDTTPTTAEKYKKNDETLTTHKTRGPPQSTPETNQAGSKTDPCLRVV